MRVRPLLLLSLALALGGCAASREARLERVRDAVQAAFPEVRREDVQPAAGGELFEIRRGPAYAYITADGRYVLRGDLVDLKSGEVLTERRRRQVRAEVVQRLSDTAIEYAPASGQQRQTVHMFVDVDCDYCRELHRQIPAMNAQGIAVRYLFYPRRGERSEGYADAERAYCAADRRKALDELFEGRRAPDARTDCDNPVGEQLAAALAIGVKGTPMTVLPDGSIVYGYISAQGLLQALYPAGVPEPLAVPAPAAPAATPEPAAAPAAAAASDLASPAPPATAQP